MKKLIALAAAAMLAMPGAAFADVLADGWQNATLDELKAARAALDQQIQDMALQEAAQGTVTFEGEGVTILDGFTLPAGVWYRKVNYSDRDYMTSEKMTESINGTAKTIYFNRPEVAVFLLTGETTFDYLSVEIGCDWTIEYIPIADLGGMAADGSSCLVSSFTCTKPTKVTATASRSGMDRGYYGISLYALTNRNKLEHVAYIASGNLEEGQTAVTDAIVSPSNDYQFFIWQVVCDEGVQWSITMQ